MEVHFTPEQEAQIVQAARASGTDAERLVKDAVLRFVDDTNFRVAVLEAKAYADRGSSSKRMRWICVLKKYFAPKCAFGGRRPQPRTCRASAIT